VVLPVEIACHGECCISILFGGLALRRSVSAGLALSVKSLYLGGAWVRLGLSNNPESLESCRFEIRGFGGSSARFSSRMSASGFSFFQMRLNPPGAHQT
jgi:hypothetical protein